MTRRNALSGAPPVSLAKGERNQTTELARAQAEALEFNLGAMAIGALPSTPKYLAAAALLSHAVVRGLRLAS